jgi:hypothetical protein
MARTDRVRVAIHLPGRGNEAHEYEYCPISERGVDSNCPLDGERCRFGLTEIVTPPTCPMRTGVVEMTFSLLRGEE